MKRKVLLLMFLCIGLCWPSYAQVKISHDFYPDVSVKFKRCLVSGETGYVDFTLTNNTRRDISGFLSNGESGRGSWGMDITLYDDEGNIYTHNYDGKGNRIINCSIGDGHYVCCGEGFSFSMPKDLTVKGRIEFADVDEYATCFQLIQIKFREMNSTQYGKATLKFWNVPITRQ